MLSHEGLILGLAALQSPPRETAEIFPGSLGPLLDALGDSLGVLLASRGLWDVSGLSFGLVAGRFWSTWRCVLDVAYWTPFGQPFNNFMIIREVCVSNCGYGGSMDLPFPLTQYP